MEGLGLEPTSLASSPQTSRLPGFTVACQAFWNPPSVAESPAEPQQQARLKGNFHGPAPTLLPLLMSFGNSLFSHLINVRTKRVLLLPQAAGK